MSKLLNNTTSLQNILDALENKATGSGGVNTSDATATENDIMLGETAYVATGKVTGTFTIDNEVTEQTDLIASIKTALSGKAAGGTPILQDKAVTPSTSSQTVTADNGYDGLDIVTVAAIPSSYVQPTATKSATTYTPGTSNQTIAAGTYCSGVQTIKGDSNLVAGNIKSGISIFGVNGTYEGSSGSGGGGTGSQNCGEWICLASLPTAYAAEPTGATYYLPITNHTICLIVCRYSSYCAYTLNGEYIDAAFPNLANYALIIDGEDKYFQISPYIGDDAAEIFVLPIFEHSN